MDLVKTNNNLYDTYEKLLLRRDDCKKRAKSAEIMYIREFGGLITESFQKKVDCIAKKKCIEYYQAAANRGSTVKLNELDDYLRETMEVYEQHLKEMLNDYEACRNAKPVSEHTVVEVKVIYRKIAKLIHPDMHPDMEEEEIFDELWSDTVDAYTRNDLEMLREVEVLVQKALQERGEEVPEIIIPDIVERIAKVQEDIERITGTDPYLYISLLADPSAVEEKKRELREEIDEYREYEEQLEQILQEFLKGGVILWPMN